jgi:Holliday junction resolvase
MQKNFMTEQQIQSKRIKELEAQGYYVLKLIRTNKNGIPDLIAIPKNTNVLFSEVKTAKGKLSKLQEYRLKELNSFGFNTEVYRGPEIHGEEQKRE